MKLEYLSSLENQDKLYYGSDTSLPASINSKYEKQWKEKNSSALAGAA